MTIEALEKPNVAELEDAVVVVLDGLTTLILTEVLVFHRLHQRPVLAHRAVLEPEPSETNGLERRTRNQIVENRWPRRHRTIVLPPQTRVAATPRDDRREGEAQQYETHDFQGILCVTVTHDCLSVAFALNDATYQNPSAISPDAIVGGTARQRKSSSRYSVAARDPSWSISACRNSTRRILPLMVLGSSANSRRRTRL